MSKFFRALTVAALLTPGFGFAAGYHIPGFVYVTPNQSLYGTMNVRWNKAAPGTPYIIAAGSAAGSSVSFLGYDSDNEFFSCYVSNTSPLYQAAIDIKNSLGDGGLLFVLKNPDSSECTEVSLGNYSFHQQ
jgi:hypothetical protein